MRKSNDTVTFISWNQRLVCWHWIAIFISRYVCLPWPVLTSSSINSFFTFHVYLWIDYYCQIPSLALLAELNTYSKVTAVTGRRWVFLWKPFLPHRSKCISLIYCHMLVKPCFRFFSWHMLLQSLDWSLGGSYNCSPRWFKGGFPSIMELWAKHWQWHLVFNRNAWKNNKTLQLYQHAECWWLSTVMAALRNY